MMRAEKMEGRRNRETVSRRGAAGRRNARNSGTMIRVLVIIGDSFGGNMGSSVSPLVDQRYRLNELKEKSRRQWESCC